jgi:hypothetical protein
VNSVAPGKPLGPDTTTFAYNGQPCPDPSLTVPTTWLAAPGVSAKSCETVPPEATTTPFAVDGT